MIEIENHARIMSLYNVIPSSFKTITSWNMRMPIAHIGHTSLTIDGIYYAMDLGFAKHPTKHKFQNLS
jgi:hypothetical protein